MAAPMLRSELSGDLVGLDRAMWVSGTEPRLTSAAPRTRLFRRSLSDYVLPTTHNTRGRVPSMTEYLGPSSPLQLPVSLIPCGYNLGFEPGQKLRFLSGIWLSHRGGPPLPSTDGPKPFPIRQVLHVDDTRSTSSAVALAIERAPDRARDPRRPRSRAFHRAPDNRHSARPRRDCRPPSPAAPMPTIGSNEFATALRRLAAGHRAVPAFLLLWAGLSKAFDRQEAISRSMPTRSCPTPWSASWRRSSRGWRSASGSSSWACSSGSRVSPRRARIRVHRRTRPAKARGLAIDCGCFGGGGTGDGVTWWDIARDIPIVLAGLPGPTTDGPATARQPSRSDGGP